MATRPSRVLLHLADRRRRAVEPREIYYLEAHGDETEVRLRGAVTFRDVRSLGEVIAELQEMGFLRVHRNHAVNLDRVFEIRPSRGGSGWEVRLDPPVNKVLPVSRRGQAELLAAFSKAGRAARR
jgi:DNA-binding LytR/AlgR family response regulator